jgi:hypothetical protein
LPRFVCALERLPADEELDELDEALEDCDVVDEDCAVVDEDCDVVEEDCEAVDLLLLPHAAASSTTVDATAATQRGWARLAELLIFFPLLLCLPILLDSVWSTRSPGGLSTGASPHQWQRGIRSDEYGP